MRERDQDLVVDLRQESGASCDLVELACVEFSPRAVGRAQQRRHYIAPQLAARTARDFEQLVHRSFGGGYLFAQAGVTSHL